jgi:hypothetical protein
MIIVHIMIATVVTLLAAIAKSEADYSQNQ